MEYIENDYMYLKLSKIRNLVNIIIFIAIILYTVYFFNPRTALYLSTIIETILVFTITFIATTVFKFSNKKIFKLISIYLLLVAIFKFDILVYLIAFWSEKEIIQCLDLKPVAICTVLESVYCFMIIAYVKSVDLNIKLIVCFFSIVSLISIFFYDISVFWGISTVLLLIILCLLRNFKLFKNNLLNYLKLFVLINLSIVVLDILSY
ncbi:sensor histidine kinase, partial [Clostridium perfringens]|nr:sensor histidine kinase [Clostridium perfringens]